MGGTAAVRSYRIGGKDALLAAGPVLVSACLLGHPCRYDGGHCRHEAVLRAIKKVRGEVIPVCPEALGGLPVPRPPAEILGGDGYDVLAGRAAVVDRTGKDVTAAFREGAAATLARALSGGVRLALLKERSPSCGFHRIYDGSFTRSLRPGPGVTAALLLTSGIKVISEEDLPVDPE